jgi:hypothetical protein
VSAIGGKRRFVILAALLLSCERGRAGPQATDGGPAQSPTSLPKAPAAVSLDEKPPAAVAGFLKGQLHAHTNASGDSDTPAAEVQSFYEARGYDFIVFTDHNAVTDTPDSQLLTLPGIELTHNSRSCDPEPQPGDACLLHINALFTEASLGRQPFKRPQYGKRTELYSQSVEWAVNTSAVAMLNHPNMQYGADVDTIVATAAHGLTLLEVGNQSWDSQNAGDANHPSTEALWDEVLSRGVRLWAAVTDDAHNYNDAAELKRLGGQPYPGNLGFVMVRAEKSPSAIKQAVIRGDFYGSTGVTFTTLELGRERCTLEVSEGSAAFAVIGEGGRTVHQATGKRLVYVPTKDAGRYVRFRVSSEGRFALTQPVFLDGAAP